VDSLKDKRKGSENKIVEERTANKMKEIGASNKVREEVKARRERTI
jgi:hypothetical protein